MKKEEFHVPFINSLLMIACVTLVSMGIAHFIVSEYILSPSKPMVFTSHQSQTSVNSPE